MQRPTGVLSEPEINAGAVIEAHFDFAMVVFTGRLRSAARPPGIMSTCFIASLAETVLGLPMMKNRLNRKEGGWGAVQQSLA